MSATREQDTFSSLLDPLDATTALPVSAPSSWSQGRTLTGGLIAAWLHRAMAARTVPGRDLRAFNISFVGPVEPEADCRIDVRSLREGRAASQMEGRVLQGDTVQAVALASFGGNRDSTVTITPDSAPDIPPPDLCHAYPYKPGISARYIQHFDFRWGIGQMPFTGGTSREMGGWIRYAQPQPEMTEAQLFGLTDAWPPAILSWLSERAPISTLNWSMNFILPLPEMDPADWFLYKADIHHACEGYGQIDARLWSEQGDLLALSRQAVAVFV